MIAPLDKERGVMDYVKAAQEVKSRRPGARFLLAGPADRSREPVAREQLTKSSAVIVLEPVDDVRPLLAGCHVFVYPSHAEGMPRVVLEALAAGRPVITTRASGCRETVDEHVNGWLVPPGDWRGLAVAMEGYLRRPELLTSAARASRTKAERQFGLERSVAGLLEAMELS
jgi:glycosyltransferase involved in cell wall biosynthesis